MEANRAPILARHDTSSALNRQTAPAIWFLSGQVAPTEPVRHIPVHCSPFRVGRRPDSALSIRCATVSGNHAEILDDGGVLVLRDLNSTNGTFVNGERLQGATILKEDDLVQFADVPFRIRKQQADTGALTLHEDISDQALALVQFDKIMSERAVTPNYQPIVHYEKNSTIGYEVLGRSSVFGMETPKKMFLAASQLELEVELSHMFRWEGVNAATVLQPPVHLFLNTHPTELSRPGLIESMVAIRELNPEQSLTLEIHEAAVTSAAAMRELRAALADLKIGLAYDDFGAGQTRLLELVEVQPDYLKFDMSLIRGIHLGSGQRKQMLATLVRMVRELGVQSLVEGVECEGEDEACREIGFELAQGFFYGEPAPARAFTRQP